MEQCVRQVPAPNRAGSDSVDSDRNRLLVFQFGDRLCAVPLDSVERITPMAELACPPGLPSALEGVLNLAGVAIPVLRIDRLFDIPARPSTLYSMLIILRIPPDDRVAIRVDRVTEVLAVPKNTFLPIESGDSFNGCAEGTVPGSAGTVHVLSPARMLLRKEQEALSEYRISAQRRLLEWEVERP